MVCQEAYECTTLATHVGMTVRMKKSNSKWKPEKFAELAELIERAINTDLPPNMAVVVDTHADGFSGFLQYAGGVSDPRSTHIGA
jgi:isopropylmalate/homocitrate/citramalate synthase